MFSLIREHEMKGVFFPSNENEVFMNVIHFKRLSAVMNATGGVAVNGMSHCE